MDESSPDKISTELSASKWKFHDESAALPIRALSLLETEMAREPKPDLESRTERLNHRDWLGTVGATGRCMSQPRSISTQLRRIISKSLAH
jgi:hypothetical protein